MNRLNHLDRCLQRFYKKPLKFKDSALIPHVRELERIFKRYLLTVEKNQDPFVLLHPFYDGMLELIAKTEKVTIKDFILLEDLKHLSEPSPMMYEDARSLLMDFFQRDMANPIKVSGVRSALISAVEKNDPSVFYKHPKVFANIPVVVFNAMLTFLHGNPEGMLVYPNFCQEMYDYVEKVTMNKKKTEYTVYIDPVLYVDVSSTIPYNVEVKDNKAVVYLDTSTSATMTEYEDNHYSSIEDRHKAVFMMRGYYVLPKYSLL